jgi:small subunit ribosomal protein S9
MEDITPKTISEQIGATGRRKEAVCHVNLSAGPGDFKINGRTKEQYLCREVLIQQVMSPLLLAGLAERLNVAAYAKGGGLGGQAGAIRLAIARALVKYDPELHAAMRKGGFLTVDARKVERKKYGRPKARKRFQFSKR